MAGYVRDPLPAIPENLPVPLEQAHLGYALRYRRKQPWHWWCPDVERPNVRVPIKCAQFLFANGAELAPFETLLAKDTKRCPQCMRILQHFMIVVAARTGSKLDEDFKEGILRFKGR
jgi:hypothetical protein